jgi:hypothetical protein
MTMFKLLTIFFTFAFSNLFAENHDQVTSLSDALEGVSQDQLADLSSSDTSLSEAGGELETETLIITGIEQGQFSPEDLISMDEAAEILEANLDLFDFDIVATIQEALLSGDVTEEEVAYTLMTFSSLSVEDRSIVAQESFSGDTSDPSWSQLSESGQEAICSAGLASGDGC